MKKGGLTQPAIFWVLRELGAVEPMKKRSGCLVFFFSGVNAKNQLLYYGILGKTHYFWIQDLYEKQLGFNGK